MQSEQEEQTFKISSSWSQRIGLDINETEVECPEINLFIYGWLILTKLSRQFDGGKR